MYLKFGLTSKVEHTHNFPDWKSEWHGSKTGPFPPQSPSRLSLISASCMTGNKEPATNFLGAGHSLDCTTDNSLCIDCEKERHRLNIVRSNNTEASDTHSEKFIALYLLSSSNIPRKGRPPSSEAPTTTMQLSRHEHFRRDYYFEHGMTHVQLLNEVPYSPRRKHLAQLPPSNNPRTIGQYRMYLLEKQLASYIYIKCNRQDEA